MRPLKSVVLAVQQHLKDCGAFDKAPFKISEIRDAISTLRDGIPIEFWEVDYEADAIGGRLELFERPSGVYGPIVTVALVRVSKSQNLCWRRLIQVKEMCHLWLDEQSAYTDSRAKFAGLIERLSSADIKSAIKHDDYVTEQLALLGALEILFPQEWRMKFRTFYEAGEISSLRLALHFRLPESFVVRMMQPSWEDFVDGAIYKNSF